MPLKSASKNFGHGIMAGGNWIIDQVKIIDVYPKPEQLGNIHRQSEGTGGAPFNVLMGLAKSKAPFPLFGAGLVGKDALGAEILSICRKYKIDTRHITSTNRAPTSYTDVMTEKANGRRTFFHARGANALWKGSDLDFQNKSPRIFHLGYLLLLDSLDKPDAKYGTAAARLLAEAQAAGVKTSVDVVSEESDRFAKIVNPALKHVDYCILNEIEAGNTTGFKIRRPNGDLDSTALRRAAEALLQGGVRELVAIHFPEGAFARTRSGQDVWQSSLKLPAEYITGTAGAGDAFCAGVLYGLHENWELKRCLETGVCIAAASLADPTCTQAIGPLSKSLGLAKKFGFRKGLV
jgi:sugar/nucleoside kinase (ribokinase family)